MTSTSTTPLLPAPSDEQRAVIRAVAAGDHAIVTAQPGAGKSSLAFQLVMASPEKQSIIVTYNRALADSTKARIHALCMAGVDTRDAAAVAAARKRRSRVRVFTLHGLASVLTGESVADDLQLSMALAAGLPLAEECSRLTIHLLVLDEAQDARPDYVHLLYHLIYRVCATPEKLQMVVVGDTRQLLYSFYSLSPADVRYMQHADQLFAPNARRWSRHELSTSFRATSAIANTINHLVEDRTMQPRPAAATAAALPVVLFVLDVYKDAADLLVQLVAKGGYSYGDVMVLCASLNERSPCTKIVAALSSRDVPVHVVRSGLLTDSCAGGGGDVAMGKVTFRTFCSSKGIEAPLVVVVHTHRIENLVANSSYVAWTRASSELVVLQHFRRTSKEELNEMARGMHASSLRIVMQRDPPDVLPPPRPTVSTATDADMVKPLELSTSSLFAFIDVKHVQQLIDYVDISVVQDVLEELDADYGDDDDDSNDAVDNSRANSTRVMTAYQRRLTLSYDGGKTYVNVASIAGSAIQLALEYSVTKQLPAAAQEVKKVLPGLWRNTRAGDAARDKLHEALDAIGTARTASDDNDTHVLRRLRAFATMATVLDATGSGYVDKLLAILNTDFMLDPGVFARYTAGAAALRTIFTELHPDTNMSALLWGKQVMGRFRVACGADGASVPVMLTTRPTIVSEEGHVVVVVLHRPAISHDDRLAALASAAVVGMSDATVTYILNLFDGAVHRVALAKSTLTDFLMEAINAKCAAPPAVSTRGFLATEKVRIRQVVALAEQERADDDDAADADADADDCECEVECGIDDEDLESLAL